MRRQAALVVTALLTLSACENAPPPEAVESAALTSDLGVGGSFTSYGATSRSLGAGAIDTVVPYGNGSPQVVFHFALASTPTGPGYAVVVENWAADGSYEGAGSQQLLTTNEMDLDGANQAAAVAMDAVPPGNHAGCDAQAQPLSCTSVGACCDVHDQCIEDNCPAGCGNITSIVHRGCPQACLGCHYNVIACILGNLHRPPAQRPGPSACCKRGDCGKRQACQKNNITYTDPCECKKLGLPITPGMECNEN